MKKILFTVAVATMCVLCGCTSSHKQAEKLIAEYEQKSDSVSQLLGMMNVNFSTEEWEYVDARAHVFQFETAAVVAENWNLTTAELYRQSGMWKKHAEEIKVPLTEEQEAYCSRYAEKEIYEATIFILKKWQELN